MKLYLISPDVDLAAMDRATVDARTRQAIGPIADLVLRYLCRDGLDALVGLECLNPPYPPLAAGETRHGRYRICRFASENDLRAALTDMGDPYVAACLERVRSIVSCRSVLYGFDGQAFLCLHHEDEIPVVPDSAPVIVEERTELLTDTDILDGAEPL